MERDGERLTIAKAKAYKYLLFLRLG